MNDKITCPECEYKNPINFSTCIKCNARLKNSKYYTENYKDFYEIFSPQNKEIINTTQFTDTSYHTILTQTINIGEDNIQLLPDKASMTHLFKITKPYVKILRDNSKKYPNYLSYYSYNNIMIKKNTDNHLLPTAILHEFTHHIFNEMIKQTLIHTLNHEKNLLIESFAWYVSTKDMYIELIGEFMAHKIQEYFLPDDFEGYTSVIQILNDYPNLDEEKIKESLYLANALSKDVIYILEHFITRKNSLYGTVFENSGLEYTIVEITEEEKITSFYNIIKESYNHIIENKVEMQAVLSQITKDYIYMNC